MVHHGSMVVVVVKSDADADACASCSCAKNSLYLEYIVFKKSHCRCVNRMSHKVKQP